jgi:hypothetical protein
VVQILSRSIGLRDMINLWSSVILFRCGRDICLCKNRCRCTAVSRPLAALHNYKNPCPVEIGGCRRGGTCLAGFDTTPISARAKEKRFTVTWCQKRRHRVPFLAPFCPRNVTESSQREKTAAPRGHTVSRDLRSCYLKYEPFEWSGPHSKIGAKDSPGMRILNETGLLACLEYGYSERPKSCPDLPTYDAIVGSGAVPHAP